MVNLRVLALLCLAFLVPSSVAAAKRPKMVVLTVKPIDEAAKKAAEVVTEILVTDLSKTNKFELISESEIGSMLGFDRQKQLLGCTEGSCLAEIGGALGCDYLLLGTLGTIGDRMRLDLKIADARKSTVVSREGAIVSNVDELLLAERKALPALLEPILGKEGAGQAVAGLQPLQVSAPPAKSSIAPYVVMGSGAALALAGAGYGAWAYKNRGDYAYDGANGRVTAGMWMGIAGAAALVGGAVWALVGDESSGPTLSAMPSSDGVFVSAVGRF